MNPVEALTFSQARESVLVKTRELGLSPPVEHVPLAQAAGRILASPIVSDRDSPALSRSVRDGFALRVADVPGALRVVGEVQAGAVFSGKVENGQAVEIMTGAPVPAGADAVVMVEHVTRNADTIQVDRTLRPGENISPQGSEARAGQILLAPGIRLDYTAIAALAMAGCANVPVYRVPTVAVVATGNELIEVSAQPLPHQIRNTNSWSLAAQITRAGATPLVLPTAADTYDATRALIEQGLSADLLLLSGGVSAGKYDLVENVLADLGAEFYFIRVRIQPGQPLVFGRVRDKFFFGLPGNPASTMVTFEVFARAAVERLGGLAEPFLPLFQSRLTRDFQHKPGLTRFLPALLLPNGEGIAPLAWGGSGDIPAMARANAFLVTDPEREAWSAGDWINVLLK